MNEVAIGHAGALCLYMEDNLAGQDGAPENLTVVVRLQGLQARKNVYDFDGWSGFLSFFEDMALNWRGWDGEKSFDSLEGDFRLSAKHDGHVRITFELREFELSRPWTATGEFTLEPGEELAAAVDALRNLLVVPRA